MIRLKATKPNLAPLKSDARQLDRDLIGATHRAVDRASRLGQKRVQQAMVAAGLGKLSKVVGQTSSLKKGDKTSRNAWGAIYAKGQTRSDDRGAGALDIYSTGGSIRPDMSLFGTGWLWIPTNRVPRRINRYRTTPALYNRSSYVNSIGPLIFKQIASNRAILVIRKVTVSPKNGRAKAMGKRAPRIRIPMKEVVAFVGIRVTRRMKRFDQHDIMRLASSMVPSLVEREMKWAA